MVNGFVYVIESPSDIDLLDGRSEGQVLCEALRLAKIPHWYSLVTTPSAFEVSLESRLGDALAAHPGRLPILHLSMHGNDQGVQITSGNFIRWNQLRAALSKLNDAMNGALLISMSSCMGGAGCRMAMHEDTEHHFWALVGNTGEALWADAAVAYVTFYHLFFKGVPIDECVEAMRRSSGDERFSLYFGENIKAGWQTFQQESRARAMAQALRAQPPSTGGLANTFEDGWGPFSAGATGGDHPFGGARVRQSDAQGTGSDPRP